MQDLVVNVAWIMHVRLYSWAECMIHKQHVLHVLTFEHTKHPGSVAMSVFNLPNEVPTSRRIEPASLHDCLQP